MPAIPPLDGASAFGGLGALAGTGMTGAAGAVTGTTATAAAGAAGATAPVQGAFASALTSSMDDLQRLQATSADLAVQAATGDLSDVHDYTIAAAQARMATEVTVAVRNKALEAFNDIMRMQV